MNRQNVENIVNALNDLLNDDNFSYWDSEWAVSNEVYSRIGNDDDAVKLGCNLLWHAMDKIKRDYFSISSVEALKDYLQKMTNFLIDEVKARNAHMDLEEAIANVTSEIF